MKITRELIKSYRSKKYGWVARKVFYTNGNTSYAKSCRDNHETKHDADNCASKMKWRN